MKNEKLELNFAEGVNKAEIVIREVEKVNELDVKAPLKLNIKGVIGCVSEFLNKRKDQEDQINITANIRIENIMNRRK